jgi:hypothetical protein
LLHGVWELQTFHGFGVPGDWKEGVDGRTIRYNRYRQLEP